MRQNWSMTIDDSNSDVEILTVKGKEPNLEHLKSPCSVYRDIFLLLFQGKSKTKYSGHDFQWAMFEITRLLTRLQSPLFLPIEVNSRSYPQIPHNRNCYGYHILLQMK